MVAIMFLIHFLKESYFPNWYQFGVMPRDYGKIYGIISSPFIHGDWKHLFSNLFSIFTLGIFVFYFYPARALKFLWISWLLSGLILWLIGRDSYHIGASIWVYSWAVYVFFSGILRKNRYLQAVSLIMVFLYGSLVWGLFPIDPSMSWEGHLSGSLAGMILAFIWRKDAVDQEFYIEPVKEEIEEDEEEFNYCETDEPNTDEIKSRDQAVTFRYIYKKDGGITPD